MNRTWRFQWRGSHCVSGDDPCIDFEDQYGEITFGEPHGTTLVGNFTSGESTAGGRGDFQCGTFDFTRRKVSTSTAPWDDVAKELSAQDLARQWVQWYGLETEANIDDKE